VHSESIQTPSLFPHFVTLQPYPKMDYIKIKEPHNDKVKVGFSKVLQMY
jgi:hypothetical protein